MNMSPIKKMILAVAAMCVVFSIVTANNLTTVMMIMSARKMNAGQQTVSEVVQQQTDNQQSADNSSSSNDSSNTGNSSSSSDSSSSSSADSSSSSSDSSSSSSDSSSSSSNNSSSSSNSGSSDNSSSKNEAPAGDKGTADKGATTGKPNSKAEVVAYFNKAVNSVKTSAKTVEQKNVTNYLAGQTTISSGISSIYNMLGGDEWLDGMLKDNSQGEATYTGADIKAKFPVEGQDWSSKLTEADVSAYSCTESNGVYTITITTIADAKSDNVKVGEGHAPKAFNVVLPGVVNDNIPSIAKSMVGTASMEYPASTAKITVDAKTGNVITAEYDLKWTINFDKMGIVLPFGTKAVYTVKY